MVDHSALINLVYDTAQVNHCLITNTIWNINYGGNWYTEFINAEYRTHLHCYVLHAGSLLG
jgi:hypothetical protein